MVPPNREVVFRVRVVRDVRAKLCAMLPGGSPCGTSNVLLLLLPCCSSCSGAARDTVGHGKCPGTPSILMNDSWIH